MVVHHVGLHALWLPIVLSAVIVFIVSSIIHTVLPWHKGDFRQLPDEERARAAIGPLAIPPGDYMIPRPSSMADMRSPEFQEKFSKGPVLIMTTYPAGRMSMTSSLVLWFAYSLVLSTFGGYIAGRALGPGADYLNVFRFVGATVFLGYSGALVQASIWFHRSWNTTIRSMLDGLLYGLLTAGTFGWLWPH